MHQCCDYSIKCSIAQFPAPEGASSLACASRACAKQQHGCTHSRQELCAAMNSALTRRNRCQKVGMNQLEELYQLTYAYNK
jgi:hypothetical protein